MSVAHPSPPRLQMRGITRRFPCVVANDRIDLDEKAREIGLLARPRSYAGWVVVPALSILLALLVASVLIIASGLVGPEKKVNLLLPLVAYRSLVVGAFGSFKGIANMIVAATPLMLTGLAVGVGLKAGLFNIGATGQVLLGGFTAALVGTQVAGAPILIAIPVALLGGMLAGALAGFIPGFLKAYTGAHEVVTTIMLNALAQLTISGLVNDVFRAPGFNLRLGLHPTQLLASLENDCRI